MCSQVPTSQNLVRPHPWKGNGPGLASRATNGGSIVLVKLTLNDTNNPPCKLADAEFHFTEGVLEGLKLVGFGIWERRPSAGCNVTFPARQYTVTGRRRSFSLLRPIADATTQDRIHEAILEVYERNEQATTLAA